MSVERYCTGCDWSEEPEPTDSVQPYCPECGAETEIDYESDVNLKEAETKTDKI